MYDDKFQRSWRSENKSCCINTCTYIHVCWTTWHDLWKFTEKFELQFGNVIDKLSIHWNDLWIMVHVHISYKKRQVSDINSFCFQIKCVLVGFDKYISYPKMMKAASYARQKDCIFLATNEDTHLPMDVPFVIPGKWPKSVASVKGVCK